MNRKQKIIISVTGIFIVLLILVGLTYAYFLTRIQGNTNTKSISVTTADLKLTYGDGNGDITAEKIQPGTTIDTKTFTVKNEGNATVNNYAVYLEELVNTLSRTSDMVFTLTCTSSVSGKACNGKTETSFPTQNGMLVTNNIDVNEIQSYELKVVYKEMNVDQSEDMNKTIGAKVQIYNLSDIVDITGNVTNATTGDYVEMQSTPKTSQIRDNKYFIPAVEPGVHTLYVKDSKGTVKGSKQITINKGSTSSINGDIITVTSDSQTISLNITNISTTLITDIGSVEDYLPFEEGTLAYNILTNSKNKTNGTEFLKTPKTTPAKESSSKYVKGTDPTSFTSNLWSATNYYISYADDYTVDETTGKFTLVNPTVATTKYTISMANNLVGKYAVWSTSKPTTSNTQNQYSINKISTNVSGITSTINYASISSASLKTESGESTLSITADNYGTSYYYRGGVEDNYVNFAGMCWKVVRIEGNGSTKLILEDKDNTCEADEYTGNWKIGSGKFGYTKYSENTLTAPDGTKNSSVRYIANYLNGGTDYDKSMATAFKNFQTGSLANYLDKLKAGDWCLNDKAYATSSDNTTALTSQELLDNQIKEINFYYDSRVRLNGKTTKEPTLKCNGTNMSKFADNTDMYVGTLTADEIIYAGGKVSTINPDSYLINDYQKSNPLSFWSLSPNYFDSGYDCVFIVGSEGRVSDEFVHNDISFRPAVTLVSSVQISTGNGTKSNPYVIS